MPNVLERLGPPEEIVEAAAPSPATPAPKTGWLEIAALVALLVPFMGWLLGLVRDPTVGPGSAGNARVTGR